MPGSLFNLGRYFKRKKPEPAAQEPQVSEQTPPQPPQGKAVSGQTSQAPGQETQETGFPPQQPQPASAAAGQIKTPQPSQPSQSQPYSGIGVPPSSADQATQSPPVRADYQSASKEPAENVAAPAPAAKSNEAKREEAAPKIATGEQEEKSEPKPKIQKPQPEGSEAASQKPQPKETELQKRAGMDILSRLTQRSNKALMAAVNKTKELQNQYIDTEHVLWGLLQDSGIYQLVSELKITPTELVGEIESKFQKGKFRDQPKFSPRVKKVLELSLSAARSLGYEFISPEHILLALAQEGEGLAAQILTKFGLTVEKLNSKISGKKKKKDKEEKSAVLSFTTDLTQMAREGKLDPVVARSREIERLMHILSRRTKNNPVLIGDAGVGKTAIVEGLAQRIAEGKVPETLLNKKILSVDLMSLIAGASHRGEFEERLKKLISEVKAAQGQIILFIDEIHNMVGAGSGGQGAMDASNILKPSLARGELQTIGTTTVVEYRKHMEKDPALERRFQPILVREPTVEQAIQMLQALKDKYEAFHKVSISDEAIEAAVRLSKRYIGDRFLPDKAVDLIDEAASSIRLPAISLPEEIRTLEESLKKQEAERQEAQKQGDQVRLGTLDREITRLKKELEEKKKEFEVKKGMTTNVVTPEIIQEIISRWTGIPVSRLTESESEKLVKLEDILHKRIIDQEEAVAAVSEAVRRGRAGLTSQKRPIGSFIFMGPTGVGKTELAKALAEVLFGSSEMMVRLDMTEYMQKHEVAKLIGAPPGYVGYEEGGQLTEAVRRKPYSVVLLDEIEKAHPDVFNILIQLLDDGRLTDNKGRTISFKNTIVIATSNIGTGLIQKELLGQMKVGEIREEKRENKNRLDTYTITPTGREIVTQDGKYWQRRKKKEGAPEGWSKGTIEQYFGGQTVKGVDLLNPQEKFPVKGFDTHVVFPSAEEMISRGGRLWRRRSTTAKEWETLSLIDYFKDHQVSNAAPDKPEEQLPTASWQTHAVSPTEVEIIGDGKRLWIRDNLQTKKWQTLTIEEYSKTSPTPQKTPPPPSGESPAASGQKLAQTPKANAPLQEKEEVKPEEKLRPEKPWKIHLFTPQGEEIVVVDSEYYCRKTKDSPWQKGKLADLLKGKNAPLVPEGKKKPSKEEREFEEKFAALTEKLLAQLRKFFKPELLNRFDEIIVFRPLTAQHMLAIVGLQLKNLRKLLEEQNLGLEVTEAAREELAVVGFDPIYGARPLRRTIQRLIENPISTMVIRGELKSGDIILVDFDSQKQEFVFTAKRMASKIAEPPPTPQSGEAAKEAASAAEVESKKEKAGEAPTSPSPALQVDKQTLKEAEKVAQELEKPPKSESETTIRPAPPTSKPEEPKPAQATSSESSAIPHFNEFYAKERTKTQETPPAPSLSNQPPASSPYQPQPQA